jgi:hypothetical protein
LHFLPLLFHGQFLNAVFFNKGFQKRLEDMAIFLRQCSYLYEQVNEFRVADFADNTIFTIFKQIVK